MKKLNKKQGKRLKITIQPWVYHQIRILYAENYSLQDIADIFSWCPTRQRILQILKK